MAERWSDPATQGSTSRSTPRPLPRSSLRPGPRPEEGPRRGSDSLEQGFDRLVNAGRQLVDGVSGARPGSRKAPRSSAGGPGMAPRLGELGRWVEDKLEWILEDEDDWREPWQQSSEPSPPAQQRIAEPPQGSSRRRPLEAISRRGSSPAIDQDWPDDDSFSRPRWQRSEAPPDQQPPAPQSAAAAEQAPLPEGSGARPLPRSSRRRPY